MAADSVTLIQIDREIASRLWQFVLARQGIGTAATKFVNVQSAARASLGFHSARLESPLATLAARTSVGLNRRTMIEGPKHSLLTVRCMRKTLHALPIDVASVAHAATRRFRVRDALRLAHNAGVSPHELNAMTDKISALLADHREMHHRVIEQMATPTAAPPIAARVALKYLWEDGHVAYRNRSPVWDAEDRVFGLLRNTFPAFDPGLNEDEATTRLIGEYFHRYGPGSVKDACWWSGLSAVHVRRAMEPLRLLALQTPWSVSPCFLLEKDYEAFLRWSASDHQPLGLGMLAHEDVALKAYFETRRRYLGTTEPAAIFNQIGEVLPTVLLDGVAVGRWQWVASTGRLNVALFRSANARHLRNQLAPIASELERRLRADSRRWAS